MNAIGAKGARATLATICEALDIRKGVDFHNLAGSIRTPSVEQSAKSKWTGFFTW